MNAHTTPHHTGPAHTSTYWTPTPTPTPTPTATTQMHRANITLYLMPLLWIHSPCPFILSPLQAPLKTDPSRLWWTPTPCLWTRPPALRTNWPTAERTDTLRTQLDISVRQSRAVVSTSVPRTAYAAHSPYFSPFGNTNEPCSGSELVTDFFGETFCGFPTRKEPTPQTRAHETSAPVNVGMT